MKKTLKKSIILAIISLISILFSMYVIVKQVVRQTKTYTLDFKHTSMFIAGKPYLPVEMNGKVYNFLFDTGSTSSSIDESLAKKLDIYIEKDTVSATILDPVYKTEICFVSKRTKLKIAGSKFYQPLVIEKTKCKDNYDGIIGMDIISQFYWLFDFENRTIQFSRKELSKTTQKTDKKLVLNYQKILETPYLYLVINDTLRIQMLFDTGAFLPINAPKKEDPKKLEVIASADLLINGKMEDDTIMNYLKFKVPSYAFINSYKNICINQNININGYSCTNFITIHGDNDYSIKKMHDVITRKITASFLTRFSEMHIDPFHLKITFVKHIYTPKRQKR